MEKYKLSFKRSFLRTSINAIECLTAFVLIFVICFLLACAEQRMSLKEAKQVTVSMSGGSFVPPPRRISDILAVLDEPGQFDPENTEKLIAGADSAPPDVNSRAAFVFFYKDRRDKAWQLGRYKQSLEDGRTALHYAEGENGQRVAGISSNEFSQLLDWLGNTEIASGNFRRGIALHERSVAVRPGYGGYKSLSRSYLEIGDFKAAEESTRAGIYLCDEQIFRGNKWGAAVYLKHRMQGQLLEAKGQFADAEPHIRTMINLSYNAYESWKSKDSTGYQGFRKWEDQGPRGYFKGREKLARNLAKQGRLVEAELEARETLKEVIGYSGGESGLSGDMLGCLGDILLKQSRFKDAEKLARVQIRIYEASGISPDSKIIADARSFLGKISVYRGEFSEAMKQFDIAKESLIGNQYFYQTVLARNPDLMLSLLKTNRVDEAMRLISSAYDLENKSFGKSHFRTAFLLGLRGMANAMMGNDGQAIRDFSGAIPILIEESSGGFERRLKLKSVIEAYFNFLDKWANGVGPS